MYKFIFLLIFCWIQQQFTSAHSMPQTELNIINTGNFVIECRHTTYIEGQKHVWNNTLVKQKDFVFEKVSGFQSVAKEINADASVKQAALAAFEYGSIKNNTDLWLFVNCYGQRGRVHNQGLHTGIKESRYGDFEELKKQYPKYAEGILNTFFVHPEVQGKLNNAKKATAISFGVEDFEGTTLHYYDYQYEDSLCIKHKLRYYFDETPKLIAIVDLKNDSASVIDNIHISSSIYLDKNQYSIPKNYKFWEIDELKDNPFGLKVDYNIMSKLMLGSLSLIGHQKGDEKDVL